MEIREWQDQKAWNEFLTQHAPESGAFLHSWSWGEFHQAVGNTVRRLGFFAGREPVAMALLIEKRLPLGCKYWYCPRGPIVDGKRTDQGEVLSELGKAAKDSGAMFLRLDPPRRELGPLDYPARKVRDIQPAETLILDLTMGEEQLLAGLHPKTRYNIRLAEKKGVEISLKEKIDDEVWALFEQTAKRDGFRLHPRQRYEKMLASLEGEPRAFLAATRYQGKVLAANLMIDQGKTRTYLHGSSSNEARNVMAPHLLHWELIKDAAKKGMTAYDWWGIAPEGSVDHPWAGVTRFKKSFGGRPLSYAGTFDIVFRPGQYKFYKMLRS